MDSGPVLSVERIDLPLPFDEFRAWAQLIRPRLHGLNERALAIAEYVTTEMLNNVLDHANARSVQIAIAQDEATVALTIYDDGDGIFAVLRQRLCLDEELDAVMALAKGKCTTAPARHTGEGIFFSARLVDRFLIQSRSSRMDFTPDDVTWSLDGEALVGTRIHYRLSKTTDRDSKAVYDAYCPQPDCVFTRTIFLVKLATMEGNLVSRSQGKRLMQGMERFSDVMLDFRDVAEIRQGFADEVFRVWPSQNPQTVIRVRNANPRVITMLKHVGYPT